MSTFFPLCGGKKCDTVQKILRMGCCREKNARNFFPFLENMSVLRWGKNASESRTKHMGKFEEEKKERWYNLCMFINVLPIFQDICYRACAHRRHLWKYCWVLEFLPKLLWVCILHIVPVKYSWHSVSLATFVCAKYCESLWRWVRGIFL